MSSLRQWLKKGTWAILDRGLFGLSGFMLNVLLARWLSPQDYGAFTLLNGLFWFVGAFHTALWVEPLLVFGPGYDRDRLPVYLGALFYLHFGITLLMSLLLVLITVGTGLAGALTNPLLGVILSGPFILFLWLMRQACYVRLEPELAAIAGTLYTVAMLLGAYLMNQYEWLSATGAFCVMGISSCVAGLWLAFRLQLDLSHSLNTHVWRGVLTRHWHFGRWSAATQGLMIAPENLYYVALTTWVGLEATATLKALRNLNTPILRINIALTSLLIPSLVEVRDQPQFMRTVRAALASFTLGPLLSWLLLGILNQPLVGWLYQGKYQGSAALIWILGIGPIFGGIVVVLNSTLRAMELPQKVFQAFCLFTPVNLLLTLGLMSTQGVLGTVIGLSISTVLEASVMAGLFLRAYRENTDGRC